MSAPMPRARVLEVTSYPPPRAGWGIRVEVLKKAMEADGHECVVLNIGTSRRIPSTEYETVLSGGDFIRKVWRYSRAGLVVHAHANGDSPTGMALAITAQVLNLLCGRRPILTFHAGAIQRHFPRHRNRLLIPAFWFLFLVPRRIICNSEAVRQCIATYGVDPAKIVAIPAFSRQYLEFTRVDLPARLAEFLARFPAIVFTYVRMRPLFYPVTLIDGMAAVMRERPGVGLVMCGGTSHSDPGVWPAVQEAIARHGIADRICFVDDLDHDAFLTVLSGSTLYLRTPITDGVASSVLESLALGIPVVACENGTRPAGVVTYPAEDAPAMAAAVLDTRDRRHQIVRSLEKVEVLDTVGAEIAVLAGAR